MAATVRRRAVPARTTAPPSGNMTPVRTSPQTRPAPVKEEPSVPENAAAGPVPAPAEEPEEEGLSLESLPSAWAA